MKYANTLAGAAFVVIAFGMVVLFMAASKNSSDAKENTAYVRVINCIISKNANQRTQTDIEKCYSVIERDFGLKLVRYDRL